MNFDASRSGKAFKDNHFARVFSFPRKIFCKSQVMRRGLTGFFIAMMLVSFAFAVRAVDCAICGKEIQGGGFLITDPSTGQQIMVCSNCAVLPRCYICGLPAKDGVQLPDGRWLCAKDAKTAVLDADDVRHIFWEVRDDMDKQYSRFTSFPTNIDVSAIDRVDVDSMFQVMGNDFESPNLLGVTQKISTNDATRYKIGLLTGQPQDRLEEVCAHELSHAWVWENVPEERHSRLARDAEEGFCEMDGYLYSDSKGDEDEKKRVLANAYTRGQVKLFVEAEQEYGYEQILDWMKYGEDPILEEGHLDVIRDVKVPAGAATAHAAIARPQSSSATAIVHPSVPTTIELQGIMGGSMPSAIINGHSFFVGDEWKVPVGSAKENIRCLAITQTKVKIQDVDSGKVTELDLPAH
jgi:hypothetical protein